MKVRKKPVVVDAITFDELIEYGTARAAVIVNGMPWAFDYEGHPITHERDDCYLIPTLEGSMRMERGDILITGVKGEIYPCKPDVFAMTYEPVNGWKEDEEDRRLGRALRVDATRRAKEWVETLQRRCPLCGQAKHGGWPCE
jgi:hypothetical protein